MSLNSKGNILFLYKYFGSYHKKIEGSPIPKTCPPVYDIDYTT